MLIGEFRYRVGLKNRVALPKKLREDLGITVMAMRGYEGSIMLIPHKNWERVVEEAIGGPLTDSRVRDTARFLMGSAHEVEPDAQGRFVLPPSLVEHGGVEVGEEVVFVGLGRWVEIWSSKRWELRLKQLNSQTPDNLKF